MDEVRLEDLYFGVVVGLVAAVSVVVALAELRRRERPRDSEVLMLSTGFAVFCGVAALVLCTGWVNLLPLPR